MALSYRAITAITTAAVSAIIAAAAAIATTVITGQFANASARSAANVRLVELAVGVLQRTPSPETRDLRTWAISVVDKYSDVALSPQARAVLTDSLALPHAGYYTIKFGRDSGQIVQFDGYPLFFDKVEGIKKDTSRLRKQ